MKRNKRSLILAIALIVVAAVAALAQTPINITVAPGQTVTITVTGVSAPPAPSIATPTCGKSNNRTTLVPADWDTFVPPAKGKSYVDPTFGCTVTRITDSSRDVLDWSGTKYLPESHGYSQVSPFNANDTYLMLGSSAGHFVTDLAGNMVVGYAAMPNCNNSQSCTIANGSNDTWFAWDATNPAVFYYTFQNYMMKGTIAPPAVAVSVLHQFTEYPFINFMDKMDVSYDGKHVVIVGGDNTGKSPENAFSYDFTTNTKGPVYTTACTGLINGPNNSCLHSITQTVKNDLLIDFAPDGPGPEQGQKLWNGTLPMPHVQDYTNHIDNGLDRNGVPVFIGLNNGGTVAGDVNACASGWGLDVRQLYDITKAVCLLDEVLPHPLPAWHTSYRGGGPNQPWVAFSFFDNSTPGPEWFSNAPTYAAPTAANWLLYQDEIILVRIDAENNPANVYRLARAYSRSAEDFNSNPKAAISRDGKYVSFDSNMAYAKAGCPANFQTPTNCTDVYVIKVR